MMLKEINKIIEEKKIYKEAMDTLISAKENEQAILMNKLANTLYEKIKSNGFLVCSQPHFDQLFFSVFKNNNEVDEQHFEVIDGFVTNAKGPIDEDMEYVMKLTSDFFKQLKIDDA